MRAAVDDVNHSLVEQLQAGLGGPLVLDGLEVVSEFACLLGLGHQVVERLEIRVGRANDEGVIAVVDVGGDKGGGFGVGTGNSKEVRA
jgi:hypothetical protein